MGNGRETSLWENRKVILICAAVSVANFQYGLDTAVVGGFQAMIGFLEVFGYHDPKLGWSITTNVQQLISSFLTVGSVVGAMFAGPVGARLGRKACLWLACVVCFVAISIQIGTSNLGGLYAGRIILGLSNAFLITFSNVYTAEVAPAHIRAVCVMFFGLWVTFGSLIGAIIDNYSKNLLSKLCYQIGMATLYATPLFLAVFLLFVPESPRWLVVHGRNAEARKALVTLRGGSLNEELLEEEYQEILRGIEEEKELATSVGIVDMFKGTDLRRTMLAWSLIVSHAAAGVFFLISYSTVFYQIAGSSNPFQLSIVANLMGFVSVPCGMALAYWFLSRRTILVFGSFTNSLCMLAIGVAYTVGGPTNKGAGNALTAFAMLYQFSYNGGIGSLTYAVAGEVVSSRLRSYTMGTAVMWNYFFSWLISFTAPYFINPTGAAFIGGKYGYIWFGSNFILGVFFYFVIPGKNRQWEMAVWANTM